MRIPSYPKPCSLYEFMTTLIKKIILLFLPTCFIGCNSMRNKDSDSKPQVESSLKVDPTSENRFKALKLQLQGSDSILLVSHEQTYGPIFNKRNDSYVEAKRIVENDVINKKAIHTTSLIKDRDKESLINILTQKLKGEPIDLAHCFDPHHAIIVISKGRIGYIEFCFSCGGVSGDKVDISSTDFDKEKWDKIYKYIDSKIPITE